MKCAYCGSDEAKVNTRSALAEGGLVKLPVCPVDETFVEESFSRPLTFQQLMNMQKAVI